MNEDNILDIEQSVPDDNVISEPSSVTAPAGEITETDDVVSDPQLEQGESEGSETTEEVTEFVEVVDLPEYTVDNPLPVMLVEPEEVEEQTELEVYSLTGKYYGTISETYLDYFEGIVEKLTPREHYLIWRSGQYAYNMAYGEDIELDGTYFSGECECVTIYRSSDSYSNDWYVDFTSDSLALSASDLFVYSDLGMYPTVERGFKHEEGVTCLFAFCVFTVFLLAKSVFDYIVKYIYRC